MFWRMFTIQTVAYDRLISPSCLVQRAYIPLFEQKLSHSEVSQFLYVKLTYKIQNDYEVSLLNSFKYIVLSGI